MRRVVITGAGIVGCSLADELTALGGSDVVVLDRGPLFTTGGSTSHAPGLVFQVNPSRAMCTLAQQTVRKANELGAFSPVGGLEIATTPERVAELHRRHGWAQSWGVESRLLDAGETRALHPLLADGVALAGLHTPTDGLCHPVAAAEAQARRAMERGARFLGDHEVLEVLTGGGGEVRGVRTHAGEIAADVVICCAGFWGPSVAALVGLDLPLVPFAHQYATTAPLLGAAPATPRPILRHQGADLYFREHGDRVGIGYYGHDPMPVRQDEIGEGEGMPSIRAFTPEDFAPAWEESRRVLPVLRDAPFPEDGMNGIFSFTPDGNPLIGEHRDVPGFFVAEAVWVTHSAGVGRAVAELVTNGRTSVALHEADLHRFAEAQRTPEYVEARATRAFVEVYDVIHPLDPGLSPRPLRTSPFFTRQVEHGAVFLDAVGWERPQWYEANAPLLDEIDVPVRDAWSARRWSPIVAAEAQRTREAVALYDMTPLMRLEVSGAGAEGFLQAMTSNDVTRPVGSVAYTLLLDSSGGIRSDLTVARLAQDRFQVGANGPLDLDWLLLHSAEDPTVTVRETTSGTACLGLWGPRARDVLQPLTRDDVSHEALRYFRCTRISVAGVPVTALRVSYVGELGWELYCDADVAGRLWDVLMDAGAAHGIVPAGRGALDALRIEKGYRSWGRDMTTEHSPDEAGLGFAVRAEVPRSEGTRRLVPLLLDDDAHVPLGSEPVFAGGEPRGYVTSAAWCPTIRAVAAYAWLPREHAELGTRVEIGYFDARLAAEVVTEPLVPDAPGLRGAAVPVTA